MKAYNKLPFKERKRHLEYSYNQTAKQEELLKNGFPQEFIDSIIGEIEFVDAPKEKEE